MHKLVLDIIHFDLHFDSDLRYILAELSVHRILSKESASVFLTRYTQARNVSIGSVGWAIPTECSLSHRPLSLFSPIRPPLNQPGLLLFEVGASLLIMAQMSRCQTSWLVDDILEAVLGGCEFEKCVVESF